jgi:hypothetical protein
MSLSGKLNYSLTGTTSATRDLGTATVSESLSYTQRITDGDAANKAEKVWGDTRSLAASTSEELDLAGGLTDGLGNTVTLNRLICLGIKASTANGSTITLGGSASNAWETWTADAGSTIKLRPGGSIALIGPDATGYAIGAGATDLLQIGNDDTSATASYSIFVMGSEA